MQSVACKQARPVPVSTACGMQTSAPLRTSLAFGPASRTLLASSQRTTGSRIRSRRSSRIYAVTQVSMPACMCWPTRACCKSITLQEEEETPPWARKEKERELAALEKDLPFGVYLLGSAIVAIAAVSFVLSLGWPQSNSGQYKLIAHADWLMV